MRSVLQDIPLSCILLLPMLVVLVLLQVFITESLTLGILTFGIIADDPEVEHEDTILKEVVDEDTIPESVMTC
jgi:hypothetical protein